MPSLKTIRKRITSVKSTQKITRAMKMVAGARLTRAQQRIVALRPYAKKTAEILTAVAASAHQDKADKEATSEVIEAPLHPLLVRRPVKKVLYLVLSSDRGLCGAFNASVSKAAEREWRERQAQGTEVAFITVGKKAREYLARRGATITHDFQKIYDGLDLARVKMLSEWIVPRYQKGEFDAVYVIYNEFKSAMTQVLVVEPLLPLAKPARAEQAATASTGGADASTQHARDYAFEPGRDVLLDNLVPMYVDVTLYRALLESQASEFGARMSAMDSATRNAKEMIGRLTLIYNRARQAGITKELMEIVGGAEALKG
jgi:F-type H+-transporting ATPase subunit gamma